MLVHKTYKTEEERLAIIAKMENTGFQQVSTEGYLIGEGHLLFDDGIPEPIPEPSHSTHISIIDAIDTSKARPVRIKRTWNGKDYFYDCFVIESLKDQYVAGDVKVGDYVIVHFDDIGEQIVTGKVFKSW